MCREERWHKEYRYLGGTFPVTGLSASPNIRSRPVQREQRRVDGFGRVFAICKTGEVDINRALVEAGMAVALPEETADYVVSEMAAKSKGVGVWRGPFTAPAAYREMLAGHPQDR
jgi:endonuclease YncB( thermonuclease family)